MADRIANRYIVESLIGQGGMADVYRAHDEILNRTVAIKVLRSKLADDPLVLVRFTREASAASKLSHPNVVDIYDVGESGGLQYIVMEYVKGQTLKQLIHRRGAVDVYEALSIMKQLVSGVAAAHASSIIHRDIKPQNILVKADGTIKITDFGIAVADGSVALTHNNAVMGSAHYLAPESAKGTPPDVRVDIYSLGIVFYELLTNSVPFAGTTPAEIAFKHMQDPMPRVRDFNPSIPQSVENIIMKATAKDPNERYATADAMLADLNHCMDPEQIYCKPLVLKTTSLSVGSKEEKGRGSRIKNGNKANRKGGQSSSNGSAASRGNARTHKPASVILAVLISLVLALGLVGLSMYSGLVRIPGMMGYAAVPAYVSKPLSEAEQILKEAGFTNLKIVRDVSDSIPKDSVISGSAMSGEIVRASDPLTLHVSKGPSFLIGDYTGQYLKDVQQKLKSQNVKLTYDIKYEGAPDTNPGIILSQQLLEPGDRIDPEALETIQFTVSSYPTYVIGEELIGMDINEAKSYLNDKGIAVQTKNLYGTEAVVSVSPDIGTSYTQEGTDSVVTLYY